MTNLPLRVGIAGYGVVGKRRHQFIDLNPKLETVAVCDQKFTNSLRVSGKPKKLKSHTDLLNESLDVLFVCLTNDVAAEVTNAGIANGLHVFCEKPPGRSLKEVAWVMSTAKKHPELKLKYGFNHRYHESVKHALEILRNGELGSVINLKGVYGKSAIINFESDWRTKRQIAGGGILLDQGIHMVDLLRLFAGEFIEYRSFVSNNFWHHNVEDNVYALMRTDAGIAAMLHSSATQWRHSFNLEITLSKGALVLAGILSGSKSYGEETLTIVHRPSYRNQLPREEIHRYYNDFSWEEEISEFADAIVNDHKIESGSVFDAIKTMETVYNIYCADEEWKSRWELTTSL